MTTVSSTSSAILPIASSTAPNWLVEAQSAIVASENQGGMLGALQNSGSPGSISSFLNNTIANSSAFALIAQNNVSATNTFSQQVGTQTYQKALAAKLNAALNSHNQVNFTPPLKLDPVIYFDNGSSLNTVTGILTRSDSVQINIVTGQEVIDTSSLINMPDGSYLNTKTHILTMPDGTRIDTVTGLIVDTSA